MKNDSRFETRRDKALAAAKKAGADAFLVTNFTNVTYLTGFTGDDLYLVLRDGGPRHPQRRPLPHAIGGRMPGPGTGDPSAGHKHAARPWPRPCAAEVSAGWPSRATR